jgi:hypothetical protein
MKTFNSWDEVKEWLVAGETIDVCGIWLCTGRVISCNQECECFDRYASVDELLEEVKYYSDGLENVNGYVD